ncbi:hypothetical protein H5410_031500 [Solanum commersonii]|uniref:Reverse transcriptase n=1 Tax=Solanum commersonii TaxID=4109 RepID=A0A9J5YIH5_SOLCO|nr:hypothetical protein H5410_031500 [Solanum commersonii]
MLSVTMLKGGGMDRPWLIGGDFNVVLSREEKIRGLLVVTPNYQEFKTCIDSCDLSQVQFRGSPFTWWNSRIEHETIKDVVRLNWDLSISSNHFLNFKRKIKKVKRALSIWSGETFRDIFQQLIIRE